MNHASCFYINCSGSWLAAWKLELLNSCKPIGDAPIYSCFIALSGPCSLGKTIMIYFPRENYHDIIPWGKLSWYFSPGKITIGGNWSCFMIFFPPGWANISWPGENYRYDIFPPGEKYRLGKILIWHRVFCFISCNSI